jgi:hypothetical protein
LFLLLSVSQSLNNLIFGMQKRGRPPSLLETEQVAVRLPADWITRFRKAPGGVSAQIRNRVAESLALDALEPNFLKLSGQIDQLAKRVHRAFEHEWHADAKAFDAFVQAVKLLLADLPKPTKSQSEVKASAADAGQLIYNDFVSTTRELVKKGRTEIRTPLRHRLEKDNG